MKRTGIISLLLIGLVAYVPLLAQEEESDHALKISGSIDTYYKYDFSGQANIPTSFAEDHNSISIGMLDLVFEKSAGKASFVGEIAFGPRNAGSAGPASVFNTIGEGSSGFDVAAFAPRIQNLYVSYAFSDVLTATAGYMGTFVGYEIISPTGNFNYSTSYLFTNGPFQNAGVKLEIAPSERFAVMVGLFNPWNVYTADPGIGPSSFGAQVYVSPADGWDAYLNFVTGGESGTELDLTTTFQITESFLLGLNAATYSDGGDTAATFTGAALYANLAVAEGVSLGARYEYFQASAPSGILSELTDASVNAITLSANLGKGSLTLIPELRVDVASEEMFIDGEGGLTSSATQALVAAVFAF